MINSETVAKYEEIGLNPLFVYMNFNDTFNGLFFLFYIMIGNNMDNLAKVFLTAKDGDENYKFFILIWFVLSNLIVLNIIIARLLEAVITKIK